MTSTIPYISASALSVINNALNHILLECSLYNSIRQSIFGDALQTELFTTKCDNNKLKYFLLDKTRKTAKYLVIAIKCALVFRITKFNLKNSVPLKAVYSNITIDGLLSFNI